MSDLDDLFRVAAAEVAGTPGDTPDLAARIECRLGGPTRLRAALDAAARADASSVRQAAAAAASAESDANRRTLTAYLSLLARGARQQQAAVTNSQSTGPFEPRTLLPPHPPRFRAGDRPTPGGNWELVEPLGVGGFGEVWMARHVLFDGIPPSPSSSACMLPRERLLRHEAAVLNQVMKHGRHLGIVQLQDAFLASEPPCLVYEYVEGGSLLELAATWPTPGPYRATQATRAVRSLAETVARMHRLAPPVVHRDLKPANVLVQKGPSVFAADGYSLRITDFGIGGLVAVEGEGFAGPGIAHTPLYAPPQQKRGDAPDPRDDVHALGVIWYQLFTGDFAGSPILNRKGRWIEQTRSAGADLREIRLLGDCVDPDNERRPADAGQLLHRLDSLCSSGTTADIEGFIYGRGRATPTRRPQPAPPPPPPVSAATDDTSDGTVSGPAASVPGGLTIPGYEIIAEVGRGALAVVYKARQLSVDRIVALKVALRGSESADRRWLIEGRVLGLLDHPNVVRVHDQGVVQGHVFQACEFVDGPDLRSMLRGGLPPPVTAAEVARVLAETLAYTHRTGIIHRDVKPANVLLAGAAPGRWPSDLSRSLKLVDFGLSMLLAGMGTEAEGIVGTPAFMAPEQALGRASEVGPAADIWAVGAVLFDTLTGRPPFPSANLTELLDRLREGKVQSPRRLRPEVPRWLEAICLKCLRKDPSHRFASCEELAEALDRGGDAAGLWVRLRAWWSG